MVGTATAGRPTRFDDGSRAVTVLSGALRPRPKHPHEGRVERIKPIHGYLQHDERVPGDRGDQWVNRLPAASRLG